MVGLFRGEEAINRLVSAVGARFIEGYAWKLLEGRNTHALHTQFGSGVATSMDQKDKHESVSSLNFIITTPEYYTTWLIVIGLGVMNYCVTYDMYTKLYVHMMWLS